MLGARLIQLGAQDIDPRFGAGHFGFAGEILLRKALGAAENALGLAQIGGDGGDRRLGGVGARLRERHVGFGQPALDPREHLPRLDHHAFLDQHLRDFAGDLRGHRRLAPGDDIAGCGKPGRARARDQGALLRRRSRRGLCVRDRHADFAAGLATRENDPERRSADHDRRQRRGCPHRVPWPARPPRGPRPVAVDRQGIETFGPIVHVLLRRPPIERCGA